MKTAAILSKIKRSIITTDTVSDLIIVRDIVKQIEIEGGLVLFLKYSQNEILEFFIEVFIGNKRSSRLNNHTHSSYYVRC